MPYNWNFQFSYNLFHNIQVFDLFKILDFDNFSFSVLLLSPMTFFTVYLHRNWSSSETYAVVLESPSLVMGSRNGSQWAWSLHWEWSCMGKRKKFVMKRHYWAWTLSGYIFVTFLHYRTCLSLKFWCNF